MTRRSRVGYQLLSAMLVLWSAGARAADEPGSDADAWFQRGVTLMRADDCTDAIPAFLKSDELDTSAAALVNLGSCYAHLRRKARAWNAYEKAANAARLEGNSVLEQRALEAMAVLGPTLTKVQIVTPRDSPHLSIRLNGEALSDYDGQPIPLDPGENTIEAAEPGKEPWRRTITANELGATLVIQVPDLRFASGPRSAREAFPHEAAKQLDLRLPGILVSGTGLAAIVVGSVLGLSAQHTYRESRNNCIGNRCTQAGVDQRDDAQTRAAASTALFGVGLVAVATGVVLWAVSPPRRAVSRFRTAVAWDAVDWLVAVSEHR
jgi:hypothetical protein